MKMFNHCQNCLIFHIVINLLRQFLMILFNYLQPLDVKTTKKLSINFNSLHFLSNGCEEQRQFVFMTLQFCITVRAKRYIRVNQDA